MGTAAVTVPLPLRAAPRVQERVRARGCHRVQVAAPIHDGLHGIRGAAALRHAIAWRARGQSKAGQTPRVELRATGAQRPGDALYASCVFVAHPGY